MRLETVQEIWNKPVDTQDAILRIHVKLLHTAKGTTSLEAKVLGRLEDKMGHHQYHFGQSGEGPVQSPITGRGGIQELSEEQSFRDCIDAKSKS